MFLSALTILPGADHDEARKRMVAVDLAGRDIHDTAVLDAMLKVPRHLFVSPRYSALAYADQPLPIQAGQTISQPYVVALMTQSAKLHPGDRVLEIGTGSGYQAAVLAEIVKEVYTIEIIGILADSARGLLSRLGYKNVHVRHGDGYQGWAEAGPFDAILVTAAAPKIPEPLIDQLKMGGRIVMPLGGEFQVQDLLLITKTPGGLQKRNITGVRFVPMTGDVRNE